MILNNHGIKTTLSIVCIMFIGLLLVPSTQAAFSQPLDGIDLSKIPALENFTGFNTAPPEALNDEGQDANTAPPEALNDEGQDANTGVPELDDASDEPNPNQVKIAFTGTVTQMDDRMDLLYSNVKIGSPVSGEYTYRLPTKDTNTDQTVGDYPHDRKAFGITVNIGGLVFKTDPKNVNFLVELVNRDLDHYLLRSYNNLPLSDTVPVEHISWQLDDETGTAITNDSLKSAPIPPILQNWKDPFGLTITGDGAERGPIDSFFIRSHIDSVKVVS
jgi:hypothetical protein